MASVLQIIFVIAAYCLLQLQTGMCCAECWHSCGSYCYKLYDNTKRTHIVAIDKCSMIGAQLPDTPSTSAARLLVSCIRALYNINTVHTAYAKEAGTRDFSSVYDTSKVGMADKFVSADDAVQQSTFINISEPEGLYAESYNKHIHYTLCELVNDAATTESTVKSEIPTSVTQPTPETPEQVQPLTEISAAALTSNSKFSQQDLDDFYAQIGLFQFGGDNGVAQSTAQKRTMPYMLRQMTEETLKVATMNMSDMLHSCSFDKYPCGLDEFKVTSTASFGNCYTFNYAAPSKQTSRPGAQHGLKVILSTEQNEYLCTSETSGFRISLQQQSEPAFPETGGFYVAGGTKTYVAITKSSFHKIDSCVSVGNPAEYFYNASYTTEGCMRGCYQRYAISRCGCADPRFAGPNGTAYCGIADIACLETLLTCGEEDILKSIGCKCPVPCDEVYYRAVITSTKIDLDNDIVVKVCSNGNYNFTNYAECKEYARKNFAYVQLYYDTLYQTVYFEKDYLTVVSALSDVDAILSLYFGTWIIVIVEFLVMIVQAVLQCIRLV